MKRYPRGDAQWKSGTSMTIDQPIRELRKNSFEQNRLSTARIQEYAKVCRRGEVAVKKKTTLCKL